MRIRKTYKFYAAHRNHFLVNSKCSRLHGHRYGLTVIFTVARNPKEPHTTTLFEELDRRVDRLIEKLDHRTLVCATDPILRDLREDDGAVRMPFPTSVENLAYFIWAHLKLLFPNTEFLSLGGIELQETDSSTLLYGGVDFHRDQQILGPLDRQWFLLGDY